MAELSAGAERFALLARGDEPRHDERPVHLRTVAEAVSFLETVPLTEAARDLLATEIGYGAARMADREVRSEAARRIASGELRLVQAHAAELRVLREAERPRPGESVQWFVDRDSAHRFLLRLHDDLWSRRAVEEAARRGTRALAGHDIQPVLRSFAEQLASGRARIVRRAPALAALPAPSVALTRVPVAAQAVAADRGRTAHGVGGESVVFSDVEIERHPVPVAIDLTLE